MGENASSTTQGHLPHLLYQPQTTSDHRTHLQQLTHLTHLTHLSFLTHLTHSSTSDHLTQPKTPQTTPLYYLPHAIILRGPRTQEEVCIWNRGQSRVGYGGSQSSEPFGGCSCLSSSHGICAAMQQPQMGLSVGHKGTFLPVSTPDEKGPFMLWLAQSKEVEGVPGATQLQMDPQNLDTP